MPEAREVHGRRRLPGPARLWFRRQRWERIRRGEAHQALRRSQRTVVAVAANHQDVAVLQDGGAMGLACGCQVAEVRPLVAVRVIGAGEPRGIAAWIANPAAREEDPAVAQQADADEGA